MSDIRRWLDTLGLGQYGEAFEEGDIGWEVLPELDHDVLKELGVSSPGHRLQILKAVRTLDDADTTGEVIRPATALPPPTGGAERRQLTVMFCDLVGSTALSENIDVEEYREVLGAYQSAARRCIEQYDGYVARYMGDGLLVYFGYPQAHEEDPERAVRAGLDIVRAVQGLKLHDELELQVRIGIATGEVVAGDIVGEGASEERAVLGETPNLAARLQGIAEPGAVVIADATRRLIEGRFELEPLPAQHLKGINAPVRAHRATGIYERSRFGAAHVGALAPLLGRDEEVAMLLRRWELAREGEGQVVLLGGEPGIGKSRITEALRERISTTTHQALSYQCSPYHQSSSFYPVIRELEAAIGTAQEDDAGVRRLKLEALLERGGQGSGRDCALIAALLSLPLERYSPLDLTPQRQKEETTEALVQRLVGLATDAPVLVVLEDAHWIDPSTAELFGFIVDAVVSQPVLVIVTHRLEFESPWPAQGHVTHLTLNRLGKRSAEAIAERVAGEHALPDEVLEQILSKSDGVPLYVEELSKNVLESGLLEASQDGYVLRGPLTSLALPSTLKDSLMARLDRLSPVKEVAQLGAVLGREFAFELLARVCPLDEAALHKALERLVEADLLSPRGRPPSVVYTFKHALIQDAAYDSLLKAKRAELHALIARDLESHDPEGAETEPELLAHHYGHGGLAVQAVNWWRLAGERAVGRSAYPEAIRHYENALAELDGVAAGSEREESKLVLLIGHAAAVMARYGFTAPETEAAYRSARDLCRALGDPPSIFPVLRGIFQIHYVLAEHEQAHAVAREFFELSRVNVDPVVRAFGHLHLGMSHWPLGEFVAARQELEQVVALYDPGRDRASALTYGRDPKVDALAHLSQVLLILGYPERGLAVADEVLIHAEELGYPFTLAVVLAYRCALFLLLRDYERLAAGADRYRSIAEANGFATHIRYVRVFSALAEVGRSPGPEVTEELASAIEAIRTAGESFNATHYLSALTEGLARAGRDKEAGAVLEDALDLSVHSHQNSYAAELHRLRGVLRPAPEAVDCYEHSLAIARGQSAKWFELRCATNLARLWRDQDRREEAQALLTGIYEWFTEGFDTPDLKVAKTLLDQLGRHDTVAKT